MQFSVSQSKGMPTGVEEGRKEGFPKVSHKFNGKVNRKLKATPTPTGSHWAVFSD